MCTTYLAANSFFFQTFKREPLGNPQDYPILVLIGFRNSWLPIISIFVRQGPNRNLSTALLVLLYTSTSSYTRFRKSTYAEPRHILAMCTILSKLGSICDHSSFPQSVDGTPKNFIGTWRKFTLSSHLFIRICKSWRILVNFGWNCDMVDAVFSKTMLQILLSFLPLFEGSTDGDTNMKWT